MQVSDFLKRCQSSSQDTYEAFKTLMVNLENSNSRNESLQLLHAVVEGLKSQKTPDEMMKQYHFSVSELTLKNQRLLLLRLPSTFAPEDWSFTFFEGLSRYKISEFEDRKIVELGCGIGWISLAMAMQNRPHKVYGLDINPRAVTCARINLYLNGYDKNGKSTWQANGHNLDEVVEFHVSDLFEYCRAKKITVDRVIGCIPQVLNPDPEFTTRMLLGDVNENLSDEFLHSLSNYAPKQGQIEDQFGLGLIAKAVEDSVYVLKGTGKVILNLGGRPGKKVLMQLFWRRGFSVRQVWQTRVEQAKDTDIRGLVEIEKKSLHRFEFFIEQGSDTPISAHTALAYADAGGQIAHGLSVYEAQMRDASHLPQIIKTLGQPGFEDARNAIDLSYVDDTLAEEKTSFLSALSYELEKSEFFPYQKTSGYEDFRKNIALYFKNYFRVYFSENDFVITPSRLVTCRNLISLYKPKRVLIDSQLASSCLADCEDIIEIPQDSDLFCEMLEKLKPEIAIYSMPEVEARTSDALLRIIETSFKNNIRVIIDISELFELSSTPKHNGVFRYLENNSLPGHVSLICGMVKNRIYSDLQVCFVVSKNKKFIDCMINAAELTYSRTPFISQFYYNCILNDLLSFQVFEGRKVSDVKDKNGHDKFNLNQEESVGNDQEEVSSLDIIQNTTLKLKFIEIAKSTAKAFSYPAIVGERQNQDTKNLLRLDYGENCLPAPAAIRHLLFEAFAHQQFLAEDCDPRPEIIKVNAERWSLTQTNDISCLLSGGVAPIFSEIAGYCAQIKSNLIFPCGSYGYFIASAEFHGATVDKVQTDSARGFKVNLDDLKQILTKNKNGSWLVLSAPIVNPTGVIYSSDELKEIADIVTASNGVLVLDSIFSGLHFEAKNEHIKQDFLNKCRWLILGGVSKEFASGGLRIGYGISRDSEIIFAIKNCSLTEPHRTLKFVLKKLYKSSQQMLSSLNFQRQVLKERAHRLTEVLQNSGWKVLNPSGGLFLIATPEKLLGKKVANEIISIQNIAQLLRENTRVVINSPEWIGIPEYFRFVLSVSDEEFEKALVAINNFYKSI
jgi:methionine S-methyltransferase